MIKVTYRTPPEYVRKMHPTLKIEWQYSIEQADFRVHGFAGGFLYRTPSGNWVASYYGRCEGDPAKTREQAILNVLPAAQALVDKYNADQAAIERRRVDRTHDAVTLRKLFLETPERGVYVNDTTTEDRSKIADGPPNYKVTIEFTNLTADQVRKLAVMLPGEDWARQ